MVLVTSVGYDSRGGWWWWLVLVEDKIMVNNNDGGNSGVMIKVISNGVYQLWIE